MNFKGFSILVSALVLIGFAQPSAAGVHLEPYVGYGTGTSDDGTTETDFSGMMYGGRLGYTTLGFAAGVEYMGGTWEADTTPATDLTPKSLGVFVGYTFPILIRAYGTYFYDAKTGSDDGSNAGDMTGSAMKLGVGFTALPFLSVNLEYLTATFDEFDSQALTPEVKATGYFLTLSIPLDI